MICNHTTTFLLKPHFHLVPGSNNFHYGYLDHTTDLLSASYKIWQICATSNSGMKRDLSGSTVCTNAGDLRGDTLEFDMNLLLISCCLLRHVRSNSPRMTPRGGPTADFHRRIVLLFSKYPQKSVVFLSSAVNPDVGVLHAANAKVKVPNSLQPDDETGWSVKVVGRVGEGLLQVRYTFAPQKTPRSS